MQYHRVPRNMISKTVGWEMEPSGGGDNYPTVILQPTLYNSTVRPLGQLRYN